LGRQVNDAYSLKSDEVAAVAGEQHESMTRSDASAQADQLLR
jgi:phage regulator Rha-like protein